MMQAAAAWKNRRHCSVDGGMNSKQQQQQPSLQAEAGSSSAFSISESTWMFKTDDDSCCCSQDNVLVIVVNPQGEDDVSVLSLENLPADEFSTDTDECLDDTRVEPLVTTEWEPHSYSLYCLEHNWFRLAKNEEFQCAMYLQGRCEILHTLRGIYKVTPATILYVVPMENKTTLLRLTKSNYKSVLSSRRFMSLDGAGSLTSVSLSSARSKQMHEI